MADDDELAAREILAELIGMEHDPDQKGLEATFGPYSTFLVVSALQLAASHPSMNEHAQVADQVRGMARKLQRYFRLGAYITTATDLAEAITHSHLIGANPGGEIVAMPFPLGSFGIEYQERLLDQGDIDRMPRPDSWPVG